MPTVSATKIARQNQDELACGVQLYQEIRRATNNRPIINQSRQGIFFAKNNPLIKATMTPTIPVVAMPMATMAMATMNTITSVNATGMTITVS